MHMITQLCKFVWISILEVASVWTRIDWTRATHSAWTLESL